LTWAYIQAESPYFPTLSVCLPLSNSWFQLSFTVPAHLADATSGLLFELGSCGLQVEESGEQTAFQAYFDASSHFRETVSQSVGSWLREQAPSSSEPGQPPPETTIIVDDVVPEDWASEWRRFFEPIYPTPSIVVCPPWDLRRPPEGGIAVVLEPNRAFGTGRHESTRLALRALCEAIRPGARVLDVGTGSGILAAAALKLGADYAQALDVDPQAVENARETLLQNGVLDRCDVVVGSAADVDGVFDVVVANITADVLKPMLEFLKRRTAPEGVLIFSGIVMPESGAFLERAAALGILPHARFEEADWVSFLTYPNSQPTRETSD